MYMDKFSDLMDMQNHRVNYYYSGGYQCKPNHEHGPAVRNHYLIHYVHKGKGIYRTNNKTYHLHAGQGFLICPGEVMYYKADSEDPWEYTWLAFKGAEVSNYLAIAHLDLENPIFTCYHTEDMEDLLHKIDQSKKLMGTLNGHLKLLSYTIEFFSLLVDDKTLDTHDSKESPMNPYVKKTIDYIYVNYWHKLTINEIADYVGLERKYLSTLFKKETQVSPSKFIQKVRVRHAYELLQNSDLSITEISNSVGYSDPLQFSKIIRKALGHPPSQIRK